MADLIKQLVDHWVGETLIGGRKAGDMVVDGQTATEIAQFKTLLAAKLREATPESSPGGSSYLVYTALLTQVEEEAPTAIVLGDNTIGAIVWARTGVGTYTGTLVGAFTENKTGASGGSAVVSYIARNTDNVINLTTAWTGISGDGLLDNTLIEIRVYP